MDHEGARSLIRRLMPGAFAIVTGLVAIAAPPVPRAKAALEWVADTLTTFDGVTHKLERAVLTVPEDREKPGGAPVRLGFLRLRATGKKPGTPIVFVAGGGAIPPSFLARVPSYGRFFEAMRASGDVILFDQRGLGISGPPLACVPDEPVPGDVFVSEARAREVFDAGVAKCAAALRAGGVHPEACTARAAADDVMEVLRTLGLPRVRLVAFSAGTDIALELLRRPNAPVDRAVLIAARGPEESWRLPSVFDTQIRRLSRAVAHDSAYGAKIPDLEKAIRDAVRRLDEHPRRIEAVDHRRGTTVALTAGGFALQMVLASDLGDPVGFSSLPAMLVSLADGDDTIFGRKLGNLYNNLTSLLNLQPIGSDCAAGADAGRVARIERESKASVLGGARVLFQRPELCQAIGVSAIPDFGDRINAETPTLFLSGALDANAPPYQAEALRWGFPNGAHIVVAQGWHDLIPVTDVQRVILNFLDGKPSDDRPPTAPGIRFFSVEKAKSIYNAGRPDATQDGPKRRSP